jgi:hypothetical protein
VKHVEVKVQDELGFAAAVREFAIGKSARDGKKMIGDALHRRDDDSDLGGGCGAADETRGVEHPRRTEQRAAAKFEGDDIQRPRANYAGAAIAVRQRCGDTFRRDFFVYIFEAHDLRS